MKEEYERRDKGHRKKETRRSGGEEIKEKVERA